MSQNITLYGKYGKGKFAIVDDEDFSRLSKYRWFVNPYGYVYRNSRKGEITEERNRPVLYLHREIVGLKYNEKTYLDHINRNKLDNQKQNLRICSYQQNNRNVGPRLGCKSQYKGVTISGTRYHAYIGHNNQTIYLGKYDLEKDAALAYDRAARKYHGEFAMLNFPEITDYAHLSTRSKTRRSKYPGVYPCKLVKSQKWRADYKGKYIGTFDTEEQAHKARERLINQNK